MLGKPEIESLCSKLLSHCGESRAEVILLTEDSALTRFANNSIHQNVAERNVNIRLRLWMGKRSGEASTNRLDDQAFDEIVERARAAARVSPEDGTGERDDPGMAGPAPYSQVPSFDEETSAYPAEKRAQAVQLVCRLAGQVNLNASGAFSTGTAEIALANSRGVFAYHAATRADFQTVVMGEDASGRARMSGWKSSEIPVESLAREAIIKAEQGRGPVKVEPGEYTVVFDPHVTHDLLSLLNMHGMGAQTLQEGRSWMNNRLGQKVMSGLVSIWDDGLDTSGIPLPFDFEGVPKQRVDIIRQGVVEGPVYDRKTARKGNTASTGHAPPPDFRSHGPLAANLFMAPGEANLEELIRSTEKGLYISRFWYTRLVHPRDCVVTGMTRDGVFMIRDGELAYPVKNLRFTQSYLQALADVEAVGQQNLLLVNDYTGFATSVPALKISRFNFTGSTA